MQTQYLSQAVTLASVDAIKNIAYFPVWWYTKGLWKALKRSGQRIVNFNTTIGFTVWVQNIFTPMFGATDIQSRIISFFMRVVQILFRGLVLVIFSVISFALFLAWPIAPLFVLYMLFV